MKQFFEKISRIFTRSMDNQLNYKEVLDIIKQSKNAKLIDVRSIQEYEEGHLDGAICIPLYELSSKIIDKIQDKDNIIILYCSSGIRSLKGKKILDNLGYRNIYNLKGGIDNI